MTAAAVFLTIGSLFQLWVPRSGPRLDDLTHNARAPRKSTQLLATYLPTLSSKIGLKQAVQHSTTAPETPQDLLRAVCDLLHTGMDPSRAWATIGVLTTGHGLPQKSSLHARIKVAGGQPELTQAVLATCTMAYTLGTSLAHTLTALGHELDSLQRASSERQIALAGPRTSARILQGLPLVGLGSAYLLGADPLRWFASEPSGAVVAVAGISCIYWGRKWTNTLIRQALAAQNS